MEMKHVFTEEQILTPDAKMPDLTNADPETLCSAVVSLLDGHKAQNIKVLEVTDQTILADYFVICTGNSNTQVKGLAGEVEYKMNLSGVDYLRMEGYEEGTWVIMDYASVLVHIFVRDQREFYNLEKLWSEGKDIDISALLK